MTETRWIAKISLLGPGASPINLVMFAGRAVVTIGITAAVNEIKVQNPAPARLNARRSISRELAKKAPLHPADPQMQYPFSEFPRA